MRKKAAIDYFKMLSHYFPEWIEENYGKASIGKAGHRAEIPK
jgi:hypothetical protein